MISVSIPHETFYVINSIIMVLSNIFMIPMAAARGVAFDVTILVTMANEQTLYFL